MASLIALTCLEEGRSAPECCGKADPCTHTVLHHSDHLGQHSAVTHTFAVMCASCPAGMHTYEMLSSCAAASEADAPSST